MAIDFAALKAEMAASIAPSVVRTIAASILYNRLQQDSDAELAVVDTRDSKQFAAAHIRGSLSFPPQSSAAGDEKKGAAFAGSSLFPIARAHALDGKSLVVVDHNSAD